MKILYFFILAIIIPGLTAFSQNIGIGTNTPAYKLDIAGRIRIKTGTLGNTSTSSGFWMEDYRDGTNRMFFGMQDSIRGGFYGAGTGGVGWAFNFNATTGDVGITDGALGITNGTLGIGSVSPAYDLYINKPSPVIGFYDAAKNHVSGTIHGDSTNLVLNAYRKGLNGNQPGDIIMQVTGGTAPFTFSPGNVGIGTYSPTEKLHISGNLKLQGTSTQMILSSNTADKGVLYIEGNDMKIGTATGNTTGRLVIRINNTDHISVTSTGEMNRLSQTGSADILPIAYARINSSGSMLSGAGLQSIDRIGDGYFHIRLVGEDISANPTAYTVIVTPFISGADDYTYPSVRVGISGDDLKIELGNYKLTYYNHGDCGCPQSEVNSYIGSQSYIHSNTGFSLLVYKN